MLCTLLEDYYARVRRFGSSQVCCRLNLNHPVLHSHIFYFTINNGGWNHTDDMLNTELNNLTSSSSRPVDIVQVSAVRYIS